MMIKFPYRVVIGKSPARDIRSMLGEMRLGNRGAIITDGTVRKLIGNEVAAMTGAAIMAPESLEIESLRKLSVALKDCDYVMGIGGGRSIDAAKYAACVAGKPWIAFPTVLSHDGVVSSRASVESGGLKTSVEASEPSAIIADIEMLAKAPYRHTASGAGDVISNISAVEDWRLAASAGKEKYHTVMAELSLLAVKAVQENVSEIKKRNAHGMEMLLWALISSGFAMNIYGSSRPASGSEHNVSHVLDAAGSKVLHGEQVALATIVTVYLQGGDWKAIKKFMSDIGLPVSAKALGIGKDMMVKALASAKAVRERYTVLNEANLSEAKAEKALAHCGII